jgi:hypothetical protein
MMEKDSRHCVPAVVRERFTPRRTPPPFPVAAQWLTAWPMPRTVVPGCH